MYKLDTITNYILGKNDDITLNKLQIILYYLQGYILTHYESPLFEDDFIANNTSGPVIESVSEKYLYCKNKYLPQPSFDEYELATKAIYYQHLILMDIMIQQLKVDDFTKLLNPIVNSEPYTNYVNKFCLREIPKYEIKAYFESISNTKETTEIKTITDVINSDTLNSLTKYPSIQTYHEFDTNKHILKEQLTFPNETDESIYITEKIDGTNIRILILNNDYVIGGREEWIYAKGDRAIVKANKPYINFLKNIIENILSKKQALKKDTLYCIYGELHGSKIQRSWTNYTSNENEYGFRVFDIWSESLIGNEIMKNIKLPEQASRWRETNQQNWYSYNAVQLFCNYFNLDMVPYIRTDVLSQIPTTLEETYDFLTEFKTTRINLDKKAKKQNKSEGIVIRTSNRKYISKLRFEDYEKTFKFQAKQQKNNEKNEHLKTDKCIESKTAAKEKHVDSKKNIQENIQENIQTDISTKKNNKK